MRPLSAILNFGHVTCTGRHFIVTSVFVGYKTMEFNTNRTVLAPNYVQLHHMVAMRLQFSTIFDVGHATYSSVVVRYVMHIGKIRKDLLVILQKPHLNRLNITGLIAKSPWGVFFPIVVL